MKQLIELLRKQITIGQAVAVGLGIIIGASGIIYSKGQAASRTEIRLQALEDANRANEQGHLDFRAQWQRDHDAITRIDANVDYLVKQHQGKIALVNRYGMIMPAPWLCDGAVPSMP